MNPKATMSIPSLVKRLRRGDEDAFECLFRQFGPKIYGTARRMFLNHEDAEELVQEVFLKIWKKRAELKDDLSFHGYLITIMKSMMYRKAKRKARFTVYQESSSTRQGFVENEAEVKLEYEDFRKYSQMAIDQLPKCQKVVFEMRYLNHRSADEIAEHLSISKRTVENHIYKATKSVREKLSGSSYLSPELFLVVTYFFIAY